MSLTFSRVSKEASVKARGSEARKVGRGRIRAG